MNFNFSEDIVEQAALSWLEDLEYEIVQGDDIAPESSTQERANYADVILEDRLRSALLTINPTISTELLNEVSRKVITATLFFVGDTKLVAVIRIWI